MEFSIIVAAHNSQSTIKPCRDAIFPSQNKNYEVIVVDDNSSDKTVEIIKSFLLQHVNNAMNKDA
jgi:glycosyltransferase involved in cell wall biosynthesis